VLANVLLIINGAAYASELPFNGLRLATVLGKRDGVHVRLFLMGDAVIKNLGRAAGPRWLLHLDRMVPLDHPPREGGWAAAAPARMRARSVTAPGRGRWTFVDWTSWRTGA
jgi:hypothetical protein